jgi:hypothetical protein
LWVLTAKFLIFVRGYNPNNKDWGHTTTIIPASHLRHFVIDSDFKRNLAEVEIRLRDSDPAMKVPIHLSYVKEFLVMSEDIDRMVQQ